MKKIIGIVFLLMIFTAGASAQSTCPEGLVCMSRAAAENLLKQSDENKALKNLTTAQADEIKTIKEENKALRNEKNVAIDELHKAQVDYARVLGENTELRSSRVRDNAIMDVLIKNSRPKKIGLINLF